MCSCPPPSPTPRSHRCTAKYPWHPCSRWVGGGECTGARELLKPQLRSQHATVACCGTVWYVMCAAGLYDILHCARVSKCAPTPRQSHDVLCASASAFYVCQSNLCFLPLHSSHQERSRQNQKNMTGVTSAPGEHSCSMLDSPLNLCYGFPSQSSISGS